MFTYNNMHENYYSTVRVFVINSHDVFIYCNLLIEENHDNLLSLLFCLHRFSDSNIA